MALAKGVPVQQWFRGPQFSSVATGFITGACRACIPAAAQAVPAVQRPPGNPPICLVHAQCSSLGRTPNRAELSPTTGARLIREQVLDTQGSKTAVHADRHPARHWANRQLGRPGSGRERIAVLTGIHPSPCETPFGDFLMSLQACRMLPDGSTLHGPVGVRWCCVLGWHWAQHHAQ